MTDEEIEAVAQRTAAILQEGIYAFKPDVKTQLAQWSNYMTINRIGYGSSPFDLYTQINNDGSLRLQLKGQDGEIVWFGVIG